MPFPHSIKSGRDENTSQGERSSDDEIDDIVVSQIDGRKNETTNNWEIEVKQNFFITGCQKQDHQDNLSMAAGHTVPFIMLQKIEHIPDQIGQQAPFERNGLEGSQGETGSDGRKEDIPDEGEVVAKGEDKDRFIKFLYPVLQIEEDNKNHREKVITDVAKRHDICKPGDDPSFHPDSRMNAKDKKIDFNQDSVNIGAEVLDQIPEGFVDEDHKENG